VISNERLRFINDLEIWRWGERAMGRLSDIVIWRYSDLAIKTIFSKQIFLGCLLI
jgi:hypothetical protein